MKYSVVIRTLGKAGDKYRRLLDSIMRQTITPVDIFVYLANGYDIPKEATGVEKYIYVTKGMVAQRALPYDEVFTDYVLFLDDDVYLPQTAVETLFQEFVENNADVISPYVFQNHLASVKDKIFRTLSGKEKPRLYDTKWSFKILNTTGFSYNNNPQRDVYFSQSNAGPCFFMKKEDFLKIHFEEELWLDNAYYSLPEDQVMYYKMYKKGLKQLTSFDSGIVHLDAGSTLAPSPDREEKLIYSEWRNKTIFWHRFLFLPVNCLKKIGAILGFGYALSIQSLKYCIAFCRGRKDLCKAFFSGLADGIRFIKTDEYKSLPLI